jgi:hypothetical protein
MRMEDFRHDRNTLHIETDAKGATVLPQGQNGDLLGNPIDDEPPVARKSAPIMAQPDWQTGPHGDLGVMEYPCEGED